MSASPAERQMRSRKGAHAVHARHDSRAITAPARAAFLGRFEREVDPECKLPPAVRARRAQHARKAYMTGLALRSAQSRRKRRSVA